ncbi:hypothetical protein [Winogradskyella immobilis]|uniref:Uncharacterized protein n=1 Tax=Winogradskyella immobilis TaxID=2816852 RepID=A0ABS8EP48_9FLAO|nr:hypothetical protein [Winogradskyella immobilis]MCC1484994.1 hypothetical protein [Winogradskyella immobilis]MCG0017086.1 hypothetical protein [Winogradskyella immobilis]
MDILGQILWFLAFLTPLVIFPIVWKISKQKKIYRLLIGLVLSIITSYRLYLISLAIIFRDGMGPT